MKDRKETLSSGTLSQHENLFNKDKTEQPSDAVALSDTWAQDALQDLEEYIESQGIYIRQ